GRVAHDHTPGLDRLARTRDVDPPREGELEQHRSREGELEGRRVDDRLARLVLGEQEQDVLGEQHASTVCRRRGGRQVVGQPLASAHTGRPAPTATASPGQPGTGPSVGREGSGGAGRTIVSRYGGSTSTTPEVATRHASVSAHASTSPRPRRPCS